ncbi:MAG: aspartate--tRNA(Asn) ligase [Clostridia bacterium]
MDRTRIGSLQPNTRVKVQGWVERIRDQKSMLFLIVKDITGALQITIEKAKHPEMAELVAPLISGSVVSVEGDVVKSEFVKLGGIELFPTNLKVETIAEVSPIGKDASIDQRLDYRWIDLRAPEKTIIFEAETTLVQAMREFMIQNNFLEIHSPKILSSSSESGSGLFEVQYFDRKAYLAQSPQFYKQMAMTSGFDRVFEIGPVFRAEPSFTSRHTTEFTGFDFEMSFIESHEDVMKMEEEMLHYAIAKVKEKHGERIKALLGVDVVVPSLPFPRVTMDKAYEILKNLDYEMDYGSDLDAESEKLLTSYFKEKTGHEFIFISDYPKEIRPFYSMQYEDRPQVTKTFDLYWKGMEITSGAQREHRYNILKEQALGKGLTMEGIGFYLDFFKYGAPPHGGMGIGVDRLMLLMLNLPTIKESMFIFRGPTRLNP